MKKNEFEKEMSWFVEFYEKALTDMQTKIWFKIFETYHVSVFHDALMKHISSDTDARFPAIGKINAVIVKPYRGGN